MSEITLEHIKAIVDGAFGRLDERVVSLQGEVRQGFTSTHARIDQQSERVDELSGHVAETNGKVRDLRSDVTHIKAEIAAIETNVEDVKDRDIERSSEMVRLRDSFLEATRPRKHKRETDDPDAPPVAHKRVAIDEGAPLTLGIIIRYWPLLVGLFSAGAGAVLLIAKIAGKW